MKASEMKLYEIIDKLDTFNPIKATFNGRVIYNDYDSTTEVAQGIYGELYPLCMVAPDRISDFKDSIVNSIEIEIVDFHHSIIKMYGKYKKS